MYITTISSKNQITLPVKLLKRFGLQPGNKIMFEEKADVLTATPLRTSVVEELAGSLNQYISPDKLNKSWDEIKEETHAEVAKYLVKKYKLPQR